MKIIHAEELRVISGGSSGISTYQLGGIACGLIGACLLPSPVDLLVVVSVGIGGFAIGTMLEVVAEQN